MKRGLRFLQFLILILHHKTNLDLCTHCIALYLTSNRSMPQVQVNLKCIFKSSIIAPFHQLPPSINADLTGSGFLYSIVDNRIYRFRDLKMRLFFQSMTSNKLLTICSSIGEAKSMNEIIIYPALESNSRGV